MVTGATGAIGEQLVNSLLQQENEVRIVARDSTKIPQSWVGRVETMVGDIGNADFMSLAVKNLDTVYHLAAIPEISDKFSEEEYFRINTDISVDLAKKCGEANVGKFVFFSSVEAMGGIAAAVKQKKRLKEEDNLGTTTLYGESKLRAEQQLLDLYERQDFPISVVRPSVVYGPNMRAHFGPLKLIRAVDEGRFMFVGSGENLVSWTYVQNVVDAAILVGGTSKSDGKTYILSDDEPYPIKEIVTLVCKYLEKDVPKRHLPNSLANILAVPIEFAYGRMGKDPPLSRQKLRYLSGTYAFETSKIRCELGYSSRVGLDEGLKATVGWYKNARGNL